MLALGFALLSTPCTLKTHWSERIHENPEKCGVATTRLQLQIKTKTISFWFEMKMRKYKLQRRWKITPLTPNNKRFDTSILPVMWGISARSRLSEGIVCVYFINI